MVKIVEMKDITFGYDNQIILEDVSIDIYKGDYIGLIGPNGSAKSTLLKIMLGILTPYKGTIHILGEEISKFTQWNKVGYVSQKSTSFNKSFPATVEEIIGANLRTGKHEIFGKDKGQAIDHVLEIVKMQDFKKRLIGNLSGGQQQRIFIAKALISNPSLLLLDEPTVGIDIHSQELFYEIIGNLNKEMDMTIVLVSHDIGVVTEKVNRIACMGDRKLFTHARKSTIDIGAFIKNVYGEKVEMIDHHHHQE